MVTNNNPNRRQSPKEIPVKNNISKSQTVNGLVSHLYSLDTVNDTELEKSTEVPVNGKKRKKKVRFGDSPIEIPLTRCDTAETYDSQNTEDNSQKITEYVVQSASTIVSIDVTYSLNEYVSAEVDDDTASEGRSGWKEEKLKLSEIDPFYIVKSNLLYFDKAIAKFLSKLVILQSRSSGTDKCAAFCQYFSMAYGDAMLRYHWTKLAVLKLKKNNISLISTQSIRNILNLCFGKVKKIEYQDEPTWVVVEDSMSSGRKILRLFKWLKEIERIRLAIVLPDSILGKIQNPRMRLLRRLLAIMAHFFAGIYYFYDNLVWAAQIGLLNRGLKVQEKRLMNSFAALSNTSFEEYSRKQNVFKHYIKARHETEERIAIWKKIKDYASLTRLVFAIVNSALIYSDLNKEVLRLISKYKKRIEAAATAESEAEAFAFQLQHESFEQLDDYFDMANSNSKRVKTVEELEKERNLRINKLNYASADQVNVFIASCCNLIMTLSRLKFRYFQKVPLFIIGLLGVISAWKGIMKNWPRKIPDKNQGKKSSNYKSKKIKSA